MEDPSSMFFPIVQSNQMGQLEEFPQSETVPPSGRTPAPFVQYGAFLKIHNHVFCPVYSSHTEQPLKPSLNHYAGFYFSQSMMSSKCAAMLMAIKCMPLNLGCPRAKPWAALMTLCWVIVNTTITRICLQR